MNLRRNEAPLPIPIEKLDIEFDVSKLRATLENHPEYFGTIKFRSTLGMDDMTDIWVRFNNITPFLDRGSLDGLMDEHDSIWYPVAEQLPEVKDIAFKLMAHVHGERLGGILISKLSPGTHIPNHRDWGWHAEYYRKYFIPIKNANGATFNFDSTVDNAPDFGNRKYTQEFESRVINPKPGQVYEFCNQLTHGVTNKSLEDRIALIVCIKTDTTYL